MKKSIAVQIDNLTDAQALAIEDMLAQWCSLGRAGASRYVCFYADGDGNFHPKVAVNGEPPKFFGNTEDVRKRWVGDEYRIDYDQIAWKLQAEASK